jgi:uncharacterized membrane protein
METWMRAMIYMMMGVSGEVIFTAIKYNIVLKHDWKLQGFTQLWTMPLYAFGGICILEPLSYSIQNFHFLARFGIYAMLIYTIEYLAAFFIYKATKQRPWDYSKHMWNLHGRITLYHFPFWGTIGIVFEAVYKYLIHL